MANINFSLILVIIVVVTGAIWILDKCILAPKRRRSVNRHNAETEIDPEIITKLSKSNGFIEFCVTVFPVLLVVFIVRSFIFEPFQIPSGSMIPTLKVGDFILVNKFNYGLRLPVTNTKFLAVGEPKRGDVIVFRFPKNHSVNYIKRVIGLPGDNIRYRDKVLTVNGVTVKTDFIGFMQDSYDPKEERAPVYKLSNQSVGKHHFQIHTYPGKNQADPTQWTVPKGMYFVMGDNRDKSYDSRFWGFVPESDIIGKAIYVWMNWPRWYQLPVFKYNGTIH